MSDYNAHLPAAFALALTLANASGNAGAVTQSDHFFQPSRVAPHLGAASPAPPGTADAQTAPQPMRLAQWFNWFNCFAGMWRRC